MSKNRKVGGVSLAKLIKLGIVEYTNDDSWEMTAKYKGMSPGEAVQVAEKEAKANKAGKN